MTGHLNQAAPAVQPRAQSEASAAVPGRRAHPVRRLYRLVRGVLALGMASLLLMVFTPIPEKLYGWLDVTGPPRKADYIVCLGGNPTRLLWAVDAYREGYAPRIIVSNRPGAAQWMRRKLIQCGVPANDVLMDDRSGTTGEHPAGVGALPGVHPDAQRFLLVTDADHSRRAAACFRRAGYRHITVVGAGFPLRSDPEQQMRYRWRILVMPRLLYEYTALVKYWGQGRI